MRPPPFSTLNRVPCCNAYLDDLIVYASTWEEHLRTLKLVFTRLHEASLTLNLVGRATITYLGRQVVQSQVCPIEAKVAAIATYPARVTVGSCAASLAWLDTIATSAGTYRLSCTFQLRCVVQMWTLAAPQRENYYY